MCCHGKHLEDGINQPTLVTETPSLPSPEGLARGAAKVKITNGFAAFAFTANVSRALDNSTPRLHRIKKGGSRF
jgi:hypothetical protein